MLRKLILWQVLIMFILVLAYLADIFFRFWPLNILYAGSIPTHYYAQVLLEHISGTTFEELVAVL